MNKYVKFTYQRKNGSQHIMKTPKDLQRKIKEEEKEGADLEIKVLRPHVSVRN